MFAMATWTVKHNRSIDTTVVAGALPAKTDHWLAAWHWLGWVSVNSGSVDRRCRDSLVTTQCRLDTPLHTAHLPSNSAHRSHRTRTHPPTFHLTITEAIYWSCHQIVPPGSGDPFPGLLAAALAPLHTPDNLTMTIANQTVCVPY